MNMKNLKKYNEYKSSLSVEKEYSEAYLDTLLQFISDEEAHGQDVDMFIWPTTRAKVIHFFKEELKKGK